MEVDNSELSPPLRLAIAYAQADLRSAFALLLRFDERLSDIVGHVKEPMFAQMKIAWWHDVIASEPSARPKGEPLLSALSNLNQPETDNAFNLLLSAWGRLLAVENWTPETLKGFASDRSAAIFGNYARWVGCEDGALQLGRHWALADLQNRFGARVEFCHENSPGKVSLRKLRPLSILSLSTSHPSGFRMVLHALTGH